MKKTAGILNTNKGQSLVETALVLPIIILILTGIIDFGLLFNNYLIISNASREAARNVITGTDDSVVLTLVSNMTFSLDQAQLTVTISPAASSRIRGNEVTVDIKYHNYLLTPIISAIVPNPVNLEAKTSMSME